MLGLKGLWVLTFLARKAVADGRCSRESCPDVNDDTDNAALLQVQFSTSVSEVAQCMEGFACGAVSAKVGESLQTGDWGSIKGLAGVTGTNFACGMGTSELNKYLDEEGVTERKDEASKAQPCILNAMQALVISCANTKLKAFEAPYIKAHLQAGKSLILQQNATYLKACADKFADYKSNTTLMAKLYTACGYPNLASALTSPPSAGSKAITTACEFGGMLLVQFVNVIRTKIAAYKAAQANDDEAKELDEDEEHVDDETEEEIHEDIADDIADQDEGFESGEEGGDEPGDSDGDSVADDIGADFAGDA